MRCRPMISLSRMALRQDDKQRKATLNHIGTQLGSPSRNSCTQKGRLTTAIVNTTTTLPTPDTQKNSTSQGGSLFEVVEFVIKPVYTRLVPDISACRSAAKGKGIGKGNTVLGLDGLW